jgi:hypothetical protein
MTSGTASRGSDPRSEWPLLVFDNGAATTGGATSGFPGGLGAGCSDFAVGAAVSAGFQTLAAIL